MKKRKGSLRQRKKKNNNNRRLDNTSTGSILDTIYFCHLISIYTYSGHLFIYCSLKFTYFIFLLPPVLWMGLRTWTNQSITLGSCFFFVFDDRDRNLEGRRILKKRKRDSSSTASTTMKLPTFRSGVWIRFFYKVVCAYYLVHDLLIPCGRLLLKK